MVKVPNIETQAAMVEADAIADARKAHEWPAGYFDLSDAWQGSPIVSISVQDSIILRAHEIFGDDAEKWLNHPNKTLNDQTPLSLINTNEGIQAVSDALGCIEHGIFK